jgi:hypothetical protein
MQLEKLTDIERMKNHAEHYIRIERKEKLSKGFTYGDYHIKADDEAINRMLGYKDAYRDGLLQFPCPWWTYEGVEISITDQQELITIGGLMMQFVQACHTEESHAVEQIKNADTIEEIETIYQGYIN